MSAAEAMAAAPVTWPIRRKLALLVAASVVIGLMVVTLTAAWQEISRYATAKSEAMFMTAQVLAAATASAAAADDAPQARQALTAIGRVAAIDYASLIDRRGETLAEMGRAVVLEDGGVRLVEGDRISPLQLLFSDGIEVSVPVTFSGESIGRLRVVGNTLDLHARILSTLLTTAIASIVALAIGLLLAMHLQRSIVTPLTRLSGAMARIRRDHNYATIAASPNRDELGVLIGTFNEMVREIADRDKRLELYREHLVSEVESRTADLAAAKETAETANNAKSQFLATMSHEIRTPMTGVLVMADLLAAGDLPARQRRYAEIIAQSGRTLLAIINDILDFSKVESGKLELDLTTTDLVEVVEAAVGLFHEKAASQDIDLAAFISPDVPRLITADPTRLNQVLGNLINNALKFTEQGHVSVNVEIDPRDAHRLRIAVADTGIGIPAEKLETIFESFSQAEANTARRFGGTGLGLAICRRLVEAMNGSISVSSELGKGSRFCVFLPIGRGSNVSGWPAVKRHEGEAPLAVIAVAGAASAAAAARYCERAGFHVSIVRSGEGETTGDYPELLITDSAHLVGKPRIAKARSIVALTSLGDGHEAEIIDGGLADVVLPRPLGRVDFEPLLAALAEGEDLSAFAGRQPTTPYALPKFPGRHVLVADDNAVNREIAIEALGRFDLSITVVEDGEEATRLIKERRFDLVLMDGSMPQMDGFEATRAIRNHEAESGLARTPIIAVTADVLGTTGREWEEAGVDRVLHKPFTIRALADCLELVLPGADRPVESSHGASVVPLLDRSVVHALRAMTRSGKRDSFARIVGLYLEHAPKTIEELDRAAGIGDIAAVARAAHLLKSMSLNIGASRVAATAREIERTAKLEHRVAHEQISYLGECFEHARAELVSIIPTGSSSDSVKSRARLEPPVNP